MRYGLYYAYWRKDWGGDFLPLIPRAKRLGFDILEIVCGNFHREKKAYLQQLRSVAQDECMLLTGAYGPPPAHNLATACAQQTQQTLAFYAEMFRAMEWAGIRSLGGVLYAYWPVDFQSGFDKQMDWERSVANMRLLADMAADYGIVLHLEPVNRFEGYLINDCAACLRYVQAVDKANVSILLDTFHMNIEEPSMEDAVRLAGVHLGHIHVGDINRVPPRENSRIPWAYLGNALREINYEGAVVMEPFVRTGGEIAKDVSLWREVVCSTDDAQLDEDAARAVKFLRELWG